MREDDEFDIKKRAGSELLLGRFARFCQVQHSASICPLREWVPIDRSHLIDILDQLCVGPAAEAVKRGGTRVSVGGAATSPLFFRCILQRRVALDPQHWLDGGETCLGSAPLRSGPVVVNPAQMICPFGGPT
jgi:hypothetical protein